MGFAAVCTALYDYRPQATGELEIKEGELLYILEKSTEDDWWKARKKADGDDDDEPEGLIPNNYVDAAQPTHSAKALYDYSRQTDEEVSFSDDAILDVYDTSDPDWTLVGVNGEYGFAPANYIELTSAGPKSPSVGSPRASLHAQPEPTPASPTLPIRDPTSPAAMLARALTGGAPTRAIPEPPQQQPTPDASDNDEEAAPALPRRPPSQSISSPVRSPPIEQHASYHDEAPGVLPSPPYNRATSRGEDDMQVQSPGGFHLYNINEMVSAMGRRRKMPCTLGLNIATGTIMLSPERTRDGPSQEWTADKITHYSIEGKHVFLELIRPSKSLDLHAGAKDTAEEIVAALGEIAGAAKGEGIKEVMAAATGGSLQRTGQVLYDFMAQGDDEVTVAVGDEVIVLDDTKSEDWWNVRRVKNGKEGVMPSSYIEVTGTIAVEPATRSGINAGRSTVEQNRLEEERLAKEAARANRSRADSDPRGPPMQLPTRGSSLGDDDTKKSKRDKRSSKSESKSRSKPDPSKTRTWTDHSGSFKVEAQFIGIADGKIHLHKTNGVKIAVPVSKMSPEDLEYVEKVTHEPIEDNIPVADLIKMKRRSHDSSSKAGASLQLDAPKVPDYDWFDFFLAAGVGPHQCERYAQAMVKDSMDESVLPDITHDTLRTLGLKEGDALKVMKYLDQRFNRNKVNGEGGLFSGAGGALHNNTSRTRPDANRQINDVVDAAVFNKDEKRPADAQETPLTKVPPPKPKDGFDDDAWDVQPKSAPAPAKAATPPPPKPPTGALADLSLLDKPLEPTRPDPKPAPQEAPAPPPQPTVTAPPQQPQQTGATPSFFNQLGQNQSPQQQPQINIPRQRPVPPPQNFNSALLPPPRPTSAPNAPQNQLQFGVQPLQPQLTGIAARPAPYGQSLDEMTAQRLQQQQQQQFQQQQMQLQPQQTGFLQSPQGFQPQFQQTQPTGFQQPQFQQQFQQPYLNGNAVGSPFADPTPRPGTGILPQATGFAYGAQSQTGVNSILPPALQPQRTGFTLSPPPVQPQQQQVNGFGQGFQPQPTGFGQPPQQGFGQIQPQPTGFGQPSQPPQQQFGQPLQAQATGFGQPPQPQQNGFGNNFPSTLPPVPPIPQSTPAPLVPQRTGPAPDVRFGGGKKLVPQATGRRANLASASKCSFSLMMCLTWSVVFGACGFEGDANVYSA
jgi:actin cytoskeleton-regulatory complex protein SLA1